MVLHWRDFLRFGSLVLPSLEAKAPPAFFFRSILFADAKPPAPASSPIGRFPRSLYFVTARERGWHVVKRNAKKRELTKRDEKDEKRKSSKRKTKDESNQRGPRKDAVPRKFSPPPSPCRRRARKAQASGTTESGALLRRPPPTLRRHSRSRSTAAKVRLLRRTTKRAGPSSTFRPNEPHGRSLILPKALPQSCSACGSLPFSMPPRGTAYAAQAPGPPLQACLARPIRAGTRRSSSRARSTARFARSSTRWAGARCTKTSRGLNVPPPFRSMKT